VSDTTYQAVDASENGGGWSTGSKKWVMTLALATSFTRYRSQ
jgi:hypothetical protein